MKPCDCERPTGQPQAVGLQSGDALVIADGCMQYVLMGDRFLISLLTPTAAADLRETALCSREELESCPHA